MAPGHDFFALERGGIRGIYPIYAGACPTHFASHLAAVLGDEMAMLCNSARRIAPRLAGCRERGSVEINRSLAVAGLQQVSQFHSAAATAAGEKSPAGRWRSPPSSAEEQGQRRWSSTEAAPAVEGLTLNVDEKVQRVKHRVPQKR